MYIKKAELYLYTFLNLYFLFLNIGQFKSRKKRLNRTMDQNLNGNIILLFKLPQRLTEEDYTHFRCEFMMFLLPFHISLHAISEKYL